MLYSSLSDRCQKFIYAHCRQYDSSELCTRIHFVEKPPPYDKHGFFLILRQLRHTDPPHTRCFPLPNAGGAWLGNIRPSQHGADDNGVPAFFHLRFRLPGQLQHPEFSLLINSQGGQPFQPCYRVVVVGTGKGIQHFLFLDTQFHKINLLKVFFMCQLPVYLRSLLPGFSPAYCPPWCAPVMASLPQRSYPLQTSHSIFKVHGIMVENSRVFLTSGGL